MRSNLYGRSPSDFRYTPLPSCTLGNIRNLPHLYIHMYISFLCLYIYAIYHSTYNLFREARPIFSLRQPRVNDSTTNRIEKISQDMYAYRYVICCSVSRLLG